MHQHAGEGRHDKDKESIEGEARRERQTCREDAIRSCRRSFHEILSQPPFLCRFDRPAMGLFFAVAQTVYHLQLLTGLVRVFAHLHAQPGSLASLLSLSDPGLVVRSHSLQPSYPPRPHSTPAPSAETRTWPSILPCTSISHLWLFRVTTSSRMILAQNLQDTSSQRGSRAFYSRGMALSTWRRLALTLLSRL